MFSLSLTQSEVLFRGLGDTHHPQAALSPFLVQTYYVGNGEFPKALDLLFYYGHWSKPSRFSANSPTYPVRFLIILTKRSLAWLTLPSPALSMDTTCLRRPSFWEGCLLQAIVAPLLPQLYI